jgi:CheY-like chemotaxis protein
MYQAGLAPEGRPIGIFLLLGPTGTGKTRTVEVLAEVLHGNHKDFLRIDCGEFQLDHEVARLIGAPPGYLGHRDTIPLLSQQRLNEVSSPACDISLVLFDEIEKAAPSMTRLLLGVLDKATLKLGDNTTVNFEKCLIFLTSNLGAREMLRELSPGFGFDSGAERDPDDIAGKLESIALGAVRRKFSPEFVNRIDAIVTYQPLAAESLSKILEHQIAELQSHVNTRLGTRCFTIEVAGAAKEFLLKRGTSAEFGARELKRTVHRNLTQPLATLVAGGMIPAGSRLLVDVDPGGEKLSMQAVAAVPAVAIETPFDAPAKPLILIVDDNADLLKFLKNVMEASSWSIVTAETAEQAIRSAGRYRIDAALVDYMLPDLNGLELSSHLRAKLPSLPVVIMTGGQMPADEEQLCHRYGLPLIQKPFLVEEVLELIRARLAVAAAPRSTT